MSFIGYEVRAKIRYELQARNNLVGSFENYFRFLGELTLAVIVNRQTDKYSTNKK